LGREGASVRTFGKQMLCGVRPRRGESGL